MRAKYFWWGASGVAIMALGLLSIRSALITWSTGQDKVQEPMSVEQEHSQEECLLVQIENDRLARETAQVRDRLSRIRM